MQSRASKILILLLLLPAFLAIGVSEGLGLAWCFGDDGHVMLEFSATDGCDRTPTEATAERHCSGQTDLASTDDHCGPCLDFALEQGEALFSKRLDQHTAPASNNLAIDLQLPPISASARTVVSNLAPQPPPRTPQSILTQRTIVLLI